MSRRIRNTKQLWEKAIEFHSAGDLDIDAMRKIRRDAIPRIKRQAIADVISAVYVDDYWHDKSVVIDEPLLAKRLASGLGVNKKIAERYAKNALKQWRGILCRKSAVGAGADTGRIPYLGSWTDSVDIICNNDSSLTTRYLLENWNSEFWKTPQDGDNYIYVRCQNRAFDGELVPTVSVFAADGGINQPPQSWKQLVTFNRGNTVGDFYLMDDEKVTEDRPLKKGMRAASEAFNYIGMGNAHACLVATVASQYFTENDPQGIQSNWDAQAYITHNGAAVWRNVDPQFSVESVLKVHNQDSGDEKFTFVAQCQNVPAGSKVALRVSDSRVTFDSGEIEIANPSQRIEITKFLPAHYNGDLIVTMKDSEGNMLPSSSLVEVSMLWNLSVGHERYMDAANQLGDVRSAVSGRDISLDMGSFTLLGGAA